MDKRLLPFKYSCLPFSYEYKKNKLVQLGWKLRKYQNWQDVYSEEGDKDVMRAFADKAIDEGIILDEYISNIHGILLNVKRWSMDKNNMHEVEAPHREDWDFLNTRLSAISQNPNFAVKILKEYYPDEIEKFQSEGIAYSVSIILVARIINNCLKKTSPLRMQEYFDCTHDDFIDLVFSEFEDSVEYRVFKETNTIFDCCRLLGVPDIEDLDFPNPDEVELKLREIVFTESKLDKFKLFEISPSDRIINVIMNSRHKYYNKIRDSAYFEDFKGFMSAYVLAYIDMPTSQAETLEDFGFYLSRHLEDKI